MLNLFWHRCRNFGDAMSPWLMEKLSGQQVNYVKVPGKGVTYTTIGSILHNLVRFKDASRMVVWGSGFIRQVSPASISKPAKVCAVRGPLSRDIFTAAGVECPAVYGDPAILMPRLYKPVLVKGARIGVVPHYVDKSHPSVVQLAQRAGVMFIDVYQSVETVINQICSCDVVVSSSLHGVIVAHAYGIPALWVEFSNKVLGGGFKFRDYFKGIGTAVPTPVDMRKEAISNSDILDLACRCDIPEKQVTALYESCPFRQAGHVL